MGIFVSRRIHSHELAGRVARLAACLVLAAMSVEMAPPAPAAAAMPAKASTTSPAAVVSQPSQASAPKTKPSKTPTEVTSLRTAYSNTFDNHDGTFMATVSTDPINYRPTATSPWTPIDLTFASVSGGKGRVRISKTPSPVEVGGPTDASGFVSLDTGSGTISLGLAPDATPGLASALPSSNSHRADVAGLLPGVDLQVVADAAGASTFLVLSSKPASSSFTFALKSPGLTPLLQPDGTISFLTKSGTEVATMPAPYANDAQGLSGMTDKVTYSLSSAGETTLLTVSLDPVWLAAATYPVYVDPSLQTINGLSVSKDAFIDSYLPNSNFDSWVDTADCGCHAFAVGIDPGLTSESTKGLVSFTLPSGVMGTTIDSAILDIFPYWQYDHNNGVAVWADRVTSSWTASKVTWNTQPNITTSGYTTHKTVQGATGTLNLTAFTQGWASASYPNYGVQINTDTQDYRYWHKFYSTEHGGVNAPSLVISYHNSDVTPVSPVGSAWTSSRVLDWNFADARGMTQTQYNVVVDNDSAFTSPIVSTGTLNGVNTSYAIPGTVSLTNGTTYYWEVEGYNSMSWSSWATGSFRWDGAAPSWNGFTAPAAQVGQSASSYAFTWNAATTGGGGDRGLHRPAPIRADWRRGQHLRHNLGERRPAGYGDNRDIRRDLARERHLLPRGCLCEGARRAT